MENRKVGVFGTVKSVPRNPPIRPIGSIDRALVLRFPATGKAIVQCYITRTVIQPTLQLSPLLDHQDGDRRGHISRSYPHRLRHVLASSQVHQVCSQPHLPRPVFRWDYSMTLWFELQLVRGKLKLQWPLVCTFPHTFYIYVQPNIRSHTSSPVISPWDL